MCTEYRQLIKESNKLLKAHVKGKIIDEFFLNAALHYGKTPELLYIDKLDCNCEDTLFVDGFYYPVIQKKTGRVSCYLRCGVSGAQKYYWWVDRNGAFSGIIQIK